MNSLNSILALICLLGLSSSISSGQRSKSCEISPFRVNCYGPDITDYSLQKLQLQLATPSHQGMHFEQLSVASTAISQLAAGLFEHVSFAHVTIDDNEGLADLELSAFQAAQSTQTLVVTNNKLLASNTLYKLADRMEATVVDFDQNALEEVPSHAFNELVPVSPTNQPPTTTSAFTSLDNSSTTAAATTHPVSQKKVHLKKVQIRNNQIKHIQANAFHLLDSVVDIALTSNHVQTIARHAFNFANHIGEESLHIQLNHNRLTAASFEANFIELNNRTALVLDLSYNQIEELREEVFKPLLARNVFIDLTGNKLTCHGVNTTWLFKPEHQTLLHKLKGISC